MTHLEHYIVDFFDHVSFVDVSGLGCAIGFDTCVIAFTSLLLNPFNLVVLISIKQTLLQMHIDIQSSNCTIKKYNVIPAPEFFSSMFRLNSAKLH